MRLLAPTTSATDDRRARPRHRVRRTLSTLAATTALVVVLSGCLTAGQKQGFAEVNDDRARHGLPALAWSPHAHLKAQAWAEHLAAQGSLSHSNLSDGFEGKNIRGIAENVGYAGSIAEVQNAFMSSSGHRANLLGNYDYLGIGVAQRGDRVYVVQVFVDV